MVVEIENLVKRYEEVIALDHFNLKVKEGEILGLLGPNGSGKTTAINCALGLLNYDKGLVEVFGQEIKSDSYDIKRKIGLVPQEVAVFYNLSVRENIDYFCGLYIDDKKLRNTYVEEAMEFVGLGDYEKVLSQKLSGGLRRRLNIACGIAHKPELIFLDEPTVAVDAQSRNFILEGIKKLNQEGATIVYTTHYLEEVENLCDRIVIMDKGKSLVAGSLNELRNMISTTEKVVIQFLNVEEDISDELLSLKHVVDVEYKDDRYSLRFEKGYNNLSFLINYAEEKEYIYESIYSESPSLNDVFLELTGKELRDS